jgi:hypothetical protein
VIIERISSTYISENTMRVRERKLLAPSVYV